MKTSISLKPVRALVAELVERRLWPVALLLVVGLVAVPVLLGSSGDTGGASSAASHVAATRSDQVGAPASDTAVATFASSGRGLGPLPKHNPFEQHGGKGTTTSGTAHASGKGPALASASTSAPDGGGADGASGGGAPGGATSTGGGVSGGGSPGTSATKPKTYSTASLQLRFGRVDRSRPKRGLTRLSPLPSATNPVLIYLGLVKGTKTAVFMLSSDATAEGDGVCKPSPRDCQTVWLKEGQTEFFDVTSGSGAVTQYELDLVDVVYSRIRSKATAANAFMRVTPTSTQAEGQAAP